MAHTDETKQAAYDALMLMAKIVRERGRDFTYETNESGGCVYTEGGAVANTEVASCLLGGMLLGGTDVAVDPLTHPMANVLWNYETAGFSVIVDHLETVGERPGWAVPESVVTILDRAQDDQDNGIVYGDVLDTTATRMFGAELITERQMREAIAVSMFRSTSARNAYVGGYGGATYPQYLEDSALSLADRFPDRAEHFLNRSLSEALASNNGD